MTSKSMLHIFFGFCQLNWRRFVLYECFLVSNNFLPKKINWSKKKQPHFGRFQREWCKMRLISIMKSDQSDTILPLSNQSDEYLNSIKNNKRFRLVSSLLLRRVTKKSAVAAIFILPEVWRHSEHSSRISFIVNIFVITPNVKIAGITYGGIFMVMRGLQYYCSRLYGLL